jgi:dTDP-4-amino-4,6-dideoxygalactose transaminase
MAMGARPVWADVNPRTGLIDADSILSRLTSKTKAIMTVDWGGAPCDFDRIFEVYDYNRDIRIIEDAAHAFGSIYKDRPVGDWSDFTCFSFQAIKHLTTVDGGALTTFDIGDLQQGRLLRWYGIDREANTKEFRGEVDVVDWGYKFHMNDVNATIGLANLPYMPEIIMRHREHARVLDEGLNREIYTSTDPDYKHVSAHWLYTTLLPNSDTRELFKQHMTKKGVQVSQVHWRNDRLTTFKPFERHDLPGVDEFSSRMICVPIHWDSDPYRVLSAMNEFQP